MKVNKVEGVKCVREKKARRQIEKTRADKNRDKDGQDAANQNSQEKLTQTDLKFGGKLLLLVFDLQRKRNDCRRNERQWTNSLSI